MPGIDEIAAGAAIGSAVIGGIGSIFGFKSAKKQKKRQKKIDRENNRLYTLEVKESIRRTNQSNELLQGTIGAQIGASGFARGSSLDRYLATVKSKNKADVDWMRTAGASRSAIMARETSARARSTEAQARSRLYGGVASTLNAFGQAAVLKKTLFS